MKGLEGKVAIVTGATKDMGEAVAKRLAAEGVKVLCCGRDVVRGEQCVGEIRNSKGDAKFVRTDVGVETDVQQTIGAAIAEFGRLDIVVNLAAAVDIGRSGGFKRVTEETNEVFRRQFEINVVAPFWFFKYAIPEMAKGGGGVFVNVSSLTGSKATPGIPAYSMSKAALEGLSRQVAVDYGKDNIRSNCISVGAISTSQSAPLHSHPVAGPALRQTQIINRSGIPDDVASMVAFLASDESSFITGEMLPVDGGAGIKHNIPDIGDVYRQKP
jgi:NAD(P)-dependent dehydrogenase (short-subunit alcohol dehydrogenase family)